MRSLLLLALPCLFVPGVRPSLSWIPLEFIDSEELSDLWPGVPEEGHLPNDVHQIFLPISKSVSSRVSITSESFIEEENGQTNYTTTTKDISVETLGSGNTVVSTVVTTSSGVVEDSGDTKECQTNPDGTLSRDGNDSKMTCYQLESDYQGVANKEKLDSGDNQRLKMEEHKAKETSSRETFVRYYRWNDTELETPQGNVNQAILQPIQTNDIPEFMIRPIVLSLLDDGFIENNDKSDNESKKKSILNDMMHNYNAIVDDSVENDSKSSSNDSREEMDDDDFDGKINDDKDSEEESQESEGNEGSGDRESHKTNEGRIQRNFDTNPDEFGGDEYLFMQIPAPPLEEATEAYHEVNIGENTIGQPKTLPEQVNAEETNADFGKIITEPSDMFPCEKYISEPLKVLITPGAIDASKLELAGTHTALNEKISKQASVASNEGEVSKATGIQLSEKTTFQPVNLTVNSKKVTSSPNIALEDAGLKNPEKLSSEECVKDHEEGTNETSVFEPKGKTTFPPLIPPTEGNSTMEPGDQQKDSHPTISYKINPELLTTEKLPVHQAATPEPADKPELTSNTEISSKETSQSPDESNFFDSLFQSMFKSAKNLFDRH